MEKVYHPLFGLLTDEEDIRIYERQQEEEYYKGMEEEYRKMENQDIQF